MRRRILSGSILSLLVTSALALSAAPARAERQALIVGCARPCEGVASAIRNLGGDVDFKYDNADAIAVSVDKSRLADIAALSGVSGVFRDVVIDEPRPVDGAKSLAADPLQADNVLALSETDVSGIAASVPDDYLFNNALIGAAGLHAQGKLGQGVIVGVIDTGTTNAPVVPALSGTVVGGENFVTRDPVKSATSRNNGPHGTWVGTTIAGHVGFLFSNTSRLVQSLNINAPGSAIPCTAVSPPCPANLSIVPMIGTAPASKIYALKIFDSRGGGSPTSRVIAAMDRAITLRRNFNKGMPSVPVAGDGSEEHPFKFDSLNIQVVNMSLGGPTLFAGKELEDQLTLEMLKVGITLVISAGNSGFPAMTGSTPGTGLGALTAAAANTSIHERILRDVQFGVGVGPLYRPTRHHQTAYFSSRGPTADGRFDPEVTANGFATFAQGTCQGVAACIAGTALAPISLVSGTSFSSPITAGGAALLRHEVPSASAAQIRNAIIGSANPRVLGDGSGRIDQGQGFIALSAALKLLRSGRVSDRVIPEDFEPEESVEENIEELGFRPVRFDDDRFSKRVTGLVPGHVAQFFVRTRKSTDKLTVTLRKVTPELPPSQQNQLFGDDIFIQVADAPTSFNVTRVLDFVAGDKTFTIDNPQTGLVRVALQGDWTNAGKISADLEIVQHRSRLGEETAEGTVAQGDLVPVALKVPAGTQVLAFSLFWQNDWAHYPTNDIDLILVDPNGNLNFDGATLNSPERAVIKNPTPGTWVALINGFTVNTRRDEWELRALADGVLLKP